MVVNDTELNSALMNLSYCIEMIYTSYTDLWPQLQVFSKRLHKFLKVFPEEVTHVVHHVYLSVDLSIKSHKHILCILCNTFNQEFNTGVDFYCKELHHRCNQYTSRTVMIGQH